MGRSVCACPRVRLTPSCRLLSSRGPSEPPSGRRGVSCSVSIRPRSFVVLGCGGVHTRTRTRRGTSTRPRTSAVSGRSPRAEGSFGRRARRGGQASGSFRGLVSSKGSLVFTSGGKTTPSSRARHLPAHRARPAPRVTLAATPAVTPWHLCISFLRGCLPEREWKWGGPVLLAVVALRW